MYAERYKKIQIVGCRQTFKTYELCIIVLHWRNWEVLKLEMEINKVVTLSHKGVFYYAYEENAIVIHNIMGYKLKKDSANSQLSCGFPESALAKVMAKLSMLEISFRVFKPTPENMVNKIKEELFDNNTNYEKFSKRADFSEAYDFLCAICEKSKECQDKPEQGFHGMKMVIDLSDEDVFRYFSMIKQKLIEKGANYE